MLAVLLLAIISSVSHGVLPKDFLPCQQQSDRCEDLDGEEDREVAWSCASSGSVDDEAYTGDQSRESTERAAHLKAIRTPGQEYDKEEASEVWRC